MSKNYMKEVAQLLGVELGEEFIIKNSSNKYVISKTGLYTVDKLLDYKIDSYTLMQLLKGVDEIEKLILNRKEKEYLSNVIKPFKSTVYGIDKRKFDEYEYITIHLKEVNGDHLHISLPIFKEDTMYKGMELGKNYSLGELGI